MTKLTAVRITGLFGRVDHNISLDASTPTIITGPNGTGKTHVLRLIQAASTMNLGRLFSLPFASIHLTFRELEIDIERDSRAERSGDDTVSLAIVATATGNAPARLTISSHQFEAFNEARDKDRRLPPWITPLGAGEYFDSRMERPVSARIIERRYGISAEANPLQDTSEGRSLLEAVSAVRVAMIDTRRLDLEFPVDAANQGERQLAHLRRGRILSYTDQIEMQIRAAKSQSLYRSQSADLRFAERALAAADKTVRDSELASQYENIARLYEEMAANGLAPDEQPKILPEKTTPTIRRILSVLLDDWEARLNPLIPVNNKLNKLRDVIDGHFRDSGKRTHMTSSGALEIRSLDGQRRVPVARLSSGEQHLLAIFSELLFSVEPGAIILIDEPEISMHMSWQHSFLEDLLSSSDAMGFQFVLATHSTGIINSRWDLVRELELPDPLTPTPGEAVSEEVDEDQAY